MMVSTALAADYCWDLQNKNCCSHWNAGVQPDTTRMCGATSCPDAVTINTGPVLEYTTAATGKPGQVGHHTTATLPPVPPPPSNGHCVFKAFYCNEAGLCTSGTVWDQYCWDDALEGAPCTGK
jgi:hypothetical protein